MKAIGSDAVSDDEGYPSSFAGGKQRIAKATNIELKTSYMNTAKDISLLHGLNRMEERRSRLRNV